MCTHTHTLQLEHQSCVYQTTIFFRGPALVVFRANVRIWQHFNSRVVSLAIGKLFKNGFFKGVQKEINLPITLLLQVNNLQCSMKCLNEHTGTTIVPEQI